MQALPRPHLMACNYLPHLMACNYLPHQVQALPRPPPGAPPQLPPGWYMAASPHGLTYYYNVETRQVPLMTIDDH